MLTLGQCESLLSNSNIEKIHYIFSDQKIENIRIYEAQFSNEYGKINFLVTAKSDADGFALSEAKQEIEDLLQLEDGVQINDDQLLDEAIKPLMNKASIEFNRSNIEAIFTKLKKFNIERREINGKKSVVINFDPTVEDNKIDELVEIYSDTTEEKIHGDLPSNYRYSPKIY